MKSRNGYIPALMIAMTIVILSACSARKNTAGSRFWQAFTTRYNVYYHGKTHYDEQIKVLENDYVDDYSQRLFIHPAEAYANPKSPQPSTNFDRTIEKMQKAISLHSIKKKPKRKAGKGSDPKYREWLKREEYNPFIHNAWYLLAKSQYMKGDFESSSATFRYIQRHFSWKPELVLECKIWEALSYCALGWTTEADNILAHVHLDQIEDKRVLALANLAFADYHIKDHRYHDAIPYLTASLDGAKGGQKVRLNFLLGQLLEDDGQYDLAYQAYKRAGSSSSSTYRTKFNARIKQSAVYHGDNIEKEVRSLKAMTRYDRNREYQDQIYYAIGNLYLSKQDTVHAIENYKLAAEKSTRNGVDKAISQLTLGGIYFAQHKYDLAQPCYSEAIPLINEEYPNYKMLKHRSDVLDELVIYSQNVTLQDSLLRLSEMPEEEQRKIIQKIIADLKEKEKQQEEDAQREEYLAQQNAQGNNIKNNTNAPAQYNLNSDDSWYFYNDATKNAGKTAFQQQWGNRKLEDNWRRRNKATFALTDDDGDTENTEAGDSTLNTAAGDSIKVDKQALARAEDPHYEEYYFKQIPKTDEEKQNSHNVIQEGLYNMGIILKDKLEDLPAAEYEFEQLLSRYPDNTYRLDTYYNLYLLHKRSGNESAAERYRLMVVTEFPESKYGMALQDPNYLENLKNMSRMEQSLYDDAYRAYLNNNNTEVHAAYTNMMNTYPLSKIMPKFMFLDALAYVTEGNGEKFKSVLREMLERYPETDITPMASSMVKQLNQGRKINGGGGKNVRGMIWSTRLSNDSTSMADVERQLTPFSEDLDKPQLFILVYSTDSVSSRQLLYDVARHNFSSFVVKDFDLEQMSFGNLGLLIVKGFANYREVTHYRTVFEQDEQLVLPPAVHPVIISEGNFNLLLSEGRTFEEYFRYLDDKENDKIEGEIPESEEEDEEKPAPADAKSKRNVGTSGLYHENVGTEPEADEPESDETKADEPKSDVTPAPSDVATDKPAVTEPAGKPEPDKPAVTAPDVTAPATTVPIAIDTPEPAKTETPKTEPAKTETPKTETPKTEPAKTEPKKGDKDDKGTRRLLKQKDEETKRREREEREERKRIKREEKARQDSIKREEKARQDSLKRAEKARQDSIKREEKAREKALRDAEKARTDSIKAVEKQKQAERKAEEQAKKDKQKQKEEARKQRQKEREQRQKEREQARKEHQKQKKEEAKARKEAAKQRQKEREQARKQREEERKAARKK